MPFPPPGTPHPITFPDGTVHRGTVFLNAVLNAPGLSIGDYTYYSDHDLPADPAALQRKLFPYLYGAQRIEIGRFCCLAQGARFVTASANHRYDGISAYPFAIFDGMNPGRPSIPGPGAPTIVGHDCWIGHDAMLLPGARLGNGVIVGVGAVVGGTVPDYAIIAGNPARVIRHRFGEDEIARLLALAWWHWPIDHILAHEAEICAGDVAALEAVRPHET